MSTTLAVVTADEPAAETPTLSAARAALARAQGLRKDADAALSEAVKAQKAAEQLVGAPDKIKARIVELERKTAGAVEPWATASGVGQPTSPHTEELDELRRQLAEAERTADEARLAMPLLNIKVRKARTSASDAIAAVRLAVVSVLADEAQSLIADIRRLDQESAQRRAVLEAAIRHLDRTMAQRRLLDAGIVAQRYTLVAFGNNQRLEMNSWQPETARAVSAPFAWKPDTWYRLKLRVDNSSDGKTRIRGKAWPAAEPEPEGWLIDRVDPIPNQQGSPGLFADAQFGVYFANLKVTPNQ